MSDLRARELRNDLGSILRRVQAGERMRVTLRGRAVADLVPVASRPKTMPAASFWGALVVAAADPGLRDELRRALPDDTDSVTAE